MDFFKLLDRRAALEEELETVTDELTSEIERVVDIVKDIEYPGDTDERWSCDAARYVLLGTNHPPESYDDIRVENGREPTVRASGTFYGSMGYSDMETVRFPKRWVGMSEEELTKEALQKWNEVQKERAEKVRQLKLKEEQERREQFEALKKEFGE
jgi:hypothetical protein